MSRVQLSDGIDLNSTLSPRMAIGRDEEPRYNNFTVTAIGRDMLVTWLNEIDILCGYETLFDSHSLRSAQLSNLREQKALETCGTNFN